MYTDAQGRSLLLVGSNDGLVYALHLLTGTLAWSFTTNGDVYATPVVHTVNGAPLIFVGSYDRSKHSQAYEEGWQACKPK